MKEWQRYTGNERNKEYLEWREVDDIEKEAVKQGSERNEEYLEWRKVDDRGGSQAISPEWVWL